MAEKRQYLVRVSYLTKVEGEDEFDALASATYGAKYGLTDPQELSTTMVAQLATPAKTEEKTEEAIQAVPDIPAVPANESDVPF